MSAPVTIINVKKENLKATINRLEKDEINARVDLSTTEKFGLEKVIQGNSLNDKLKKACEIANEYFKNNDKNFSFIIEIFYEVEYCKFINYVIKLKKSEILKLKECLKEE